MSFNLSFNHSFLVQTFNSAYSTIPTLLSKVPVQHKELLVTVYPIWYKHTTVSWSIPPAWGGAKYNVYYGQTQDGPWELINPTLLTSPFLTQSVSKDYSRFNKGYFVVEALLLDQGGISVKSTPTTTNTFQSNWVGLRSTEIQRREYMLLSKFVGVKSYLFRKKAFGVRCPACWSTTLEKVIKDHCAVCVGTGFEGGYFDPIPLYLQYDPSPNSNTKGYYGVVESNQIGVWTISVPELRLDDIVIRTGDWDVYLIARINTTELQANVVKQAAVFTQISKDSIEYNLVTRNLPEFPQAYT